VVDSALPSVAGASLDLRPFFGALDDDPDAAVELSDPECFSSLECGAASTDKIENTAMRRKIAIVSFILGRSTIIEVKTRALILIMFVK